MSTANGPSPLSDDDRLRLAYRKAMSRKKRKEREAAEEIKDLNITAMMDMMTIILVFLMKSYSSSSVAMTSSEDVRPPVSSTRLTPRDTIAVTVTPRSILVGAKQVVSLQNGAIPKEVMRGRLVLPLSEALKKEVDKLKWIAEKNPNAAFARELSVIGHRTIPYELLMTVLYAAGQNELEKFRFVVLQKDG